MLFRNSGWGKEYIRNTWTIVGDKLRLQILPAKPHEHRGSSEPTVLGQWNTVELLQAYEVYFVPGYYITFKFNGEVQWKANLAELGKEVDPVQDLTVYVGHDPLSTWSTWSDSTSLNHKLHDVYIDNFKIETWPNEHDSEDVEIPDVEFEPNRTERVGDGTCMAGWETVFDLCIDLRAADGKGITWYDARESCRSDNTSLIRIENDLHNYELSLLAGDRAVWIGGNDLKDEGTWTDSEGRPLAYTKWHNRYKRPGYNIDVPQQPDNKNGEQHCAHLASAKRNFMNAGMWVTWKKWMDKECHKKLKTYACAYKRFGKTVHAINLHNAFW